MTNAEGGEEKGRVDILQLLQQEHRDVEEMLAAFDSTGTTARIQLFWDLTHELMRHEVAEETAVYPAVRDLPGGEAIARARVEEHAAAEQKLAQMEKLDAESDEFARQVIILRSVVLVHARAEETSAFVLLADNLSAGQRLELGARYLRAREAAPTRPHPHTPHSPFANVVLGPVAALVDRIRDAASAA